MAETPGTSQPEIKLFYCYAREDEALRDELHVNLAGLRRQYRLSSWHDGKIIAGKDWEQTINHHLSTADLILLLISPDFLDSENCERQMKRALERYRTGTCLVIPIFLRPVHTGNAPFNHIQTLPTNGKPITRWSNRDNALENVAIGIENTIKDLLSGVTRLPPEPPAGTSTSVITDKLPPEPAVPVTTSDTVISNKAGGDGTSSRPDPSTFGNQTKQFISRRQLINLTLVGGGFLGGFLVGGGITEIVLSQKSISKITPTPTLTHTPNPTPTLRLGTTLYTYKGHSSFIESIAWSPGGQRIASGSNDNTVQIWQAS